MKRARTSGGSLTGGTGDVKPQILTATTPAAAGAGDYSVSQIALPVPRFGTTKNKSTVTEILNVVYYPVILDIADALNTKAAFLSTIAIRTQNETCTLATLAADVTDPSVFAYMLRDAAFTTSGSVVKKGGWKFDLTDRNGNGLLIATDRIFFTIGAVNDTAQGTSTAKITYRLVNVNLAEYIGIVQSQS